MYVKKHCVDIVSRDIYNRHKVVMNEFLRWKKVNEVVSISYLLLNSKVEKKQFYDCIFDLIETQIIFREEYSVCPYCGSEEVVNGKFQRCKCCGKRYLVQDTIEKLDLSGFDEILWEK